MARRKRLRSDITKKGPARAPHRALMYASGLSPAEIERGLLPNDTALVGSMVADICYGNAARYFGFEGLPEPTS